MKEYLVKTECGRNFGWSAFDLDSLFRDLTDKGYRAIHVEEVGSNASSTAS